MNYWACFHCDLLFEVNTGQSTDCPQCGRALIRHSPEQIFEITGSLKAVLETESVRAEELDGPTGSMESGRSLDHTMILSVDDTQGTASPPPSRSSVWTSAADEVTERSEPTQIARLSDLSPIEQGPDPTPRKRPLKDGPDPTPRKRAGRGPRARAEVPKVDVVDRRTLDHASPKPILETADEPTRPSALPATELAAGKVDVSLFEQPVTERSDMLGPMVDQHLAESVELAGPADEKAVRRNSTHWGTGITVAVLVGLVVAALLTRPQKTSAPASTIVAEESSLRPIFDGLGIKLLPASGVELFSDDVWLALGLESARGSLGVIPGLTSLRVLMRVVTEDSEGGHAPAITQALEAALPAPRVGIALDPAASAEDLAIVARSLQKGGQSHFGLLVERRMDGRVAHFPFVMGSGDVPAVGHAVIKVGNLGVRADVVGRDGVVVPPEGRLIKDQENGQLDFKAVDERLGNLSRRHPLVRVATVHLETGLDIVSIVSLLERVRIGPDKERFVQIRLVVR